MTKRSELTALGFTFFAIFGLIAGCGPSMNEDEVRARLEKLEHVQISIEPTLPGAQASDVKNYFAIFDGSGSMCEPPSRCTGEKKSDFPSKVDGAKWAMEEFLKKVPNEDNLALYIFDHRHQEEIVPLGANNRDQVLATIRAVTCGGGTPLAGSMNYGTDRLGEQYQRQLGGGQYNIVVVTDGEANGIPEAAEYAIVRGIQIHTIGLCLGQDHELKSYSTTYRAADSFQDMVRGLQAIVEKEEEPAAKKPTYLQVITPTPTPNGQ